MNMWHWGYGEWWMGLIMGLVWLTLIAAVVWAVRSTSRRPGSHESEPSATALHILEERYARGEIDDDEFRRRRAALAESAR